MAELVVAAQDGDRAAFDELVRLTYADTYTLAFRLTGDEEDAGDVVQESYLRAYRGLKRFRGDAQFSTWLYRITANCAVDPPGPAGPAPPRRARRRRGRRRPAARGQPRGVARRRRRSATACRSRCGRCRPGCGPSSCSATSTTCPTRRSPPSSASPSRRPRCACTGPAASCASTCSPCPARRSSTARPRPHASRRRGRRPCGVTRSPTGWPTSPSGSVELDDAERGATSSSACAARPSSCSTASCCAPCGPCAPRCSSPRPGLLADILASLEEAGERRAVRSLLSGRRAAYVGGIAAAAAAAAAAGGALVIASRSRRRLAARRLTRPDGSMFGPLSGRLFAILPPWTVPPRAVAQLVEHRSPKPAVGGSSPSCPAPVRHTDVRERLTEGVPSWP